MYIQGTIIVNEKQADVFELEKIRTKIVNLSNKYSHLNGLCDDTLIYINELINELRKNN